MQLTNYGFNNPQNIYSYKYMKTLKECYKKRPTGFCGCLSHPDIQNSPLLLTES